MSSYIVQLVHLEQENERLKQELDSEMRRKDTAQSSLAKTSVLVRDLRFQLTHSKEEISRLTAEVAGLEKELNETKKSRDAWRDASSVRPETIREIGKQIREEGAAREELTGAARDLRDANEVYRYNHDFFSSSHIKTGRAWDDMRRASQRLSGVLADDAHRQTVSIETCGTDHEAGAKPKQDPVQIAPFQLWPAQPAWKEKAAEIHNHFLESGRHDIEPGDDEEVYFLALGLAGEAGELCNLLKKSWRGDTMPVPHVVDELADVRIYVEHLAMVLGIDLDDACDKKAAEVLERWKA